MNKFSNIALYLIMEIFMSIIVIISSFDIIFKTLFLSIIIAGFSLIEMGSNKDNILLILGLAIWIAFITISIELEVYNVITTLYTFIIYLLVAGYVALSIVYTFTKQKRFFIFKEGETK